MRSHILAACALLALAAPALPQSDTTKRIAPQKGWLTDLNAARAVAQKTGKPLMIVFRCDP